MVMRSALILIPTVVLILLTGCDRAPARREIRVRLTPAAKRASPVSGRQRGLPPSDAKGYACAILEELEHAPERGLAKIAADPKRFAHAGEVDCVIAAIDTISERFVREERDRYLDLIAALWSASDGDVADAITYDAGVVLLDDGFDATLDYLYRHREQNDLEGVIVEGALAVIDDSDEPMDELAAFRDDFRDHARGRARDERQYLAALFRRIVAKATIYDQDDAGGRTIVNRRSGRHLDHAAVAGTVHARQDTLVERPDPIVHRRDLHAHVAASRGRVIRRARE